MLPETQAEALNAIKKVVGEQALDKGLWFQPQSITEDYLQKALRRLHAFIEENDAILEILNRGTEPDKIEKGELKIPKGQQDEWNAEMVKDQAERETAYNDGYRQCWEDMKKETPADRESPAFTVGDIVEYSVMGGPRTIIGKVKAIHPFHKRIHCYCDIVCDDKSSWVAEESHLKLFFPLSRVPKELKLANGEIRCKPSGTVVETESKHFGLVTSIDSSNRYPISVICWHPESAEFINTHCWSDEIKRVVWQMEESK